MDAHLLKKSLFILVLTIFCCLFQILNAKVSRLEHLIHLKDQRIDDLQARIESMRPTGIRR